MKKYFILIFAAFVFMSGCTSKINIEAEKTAIKAVLTDLEKSLEENDLELFSTLVSHSPDNVFIGTDLNERWTGYDKLFKAQEQFFNSVDKGSIIEFREITFNINKYGQAAWLFCLMDWKGKSQQETFTIEGARLTIVFEKLDGKWQIVHLHTSIPVSGQVIQY